ncbi:alpha/beta fold hydrolase [Nocardioides acrostichi]|uniref:Alpha/beta fold hydrolase n=1 Tax=Nocardioides acrostichi TaxID=2784339 RepID=A0A930V4D8_9ACTN|nr:alpha/beta fold hydrolase [Nocardioides acrostichi]MBF4163622.1 alpha/beta fold hydrolase [Nocardioides acrostichi]
MRIRTALALLATAGVAGVVATWPRPGQAVARASFALAERQAGLSRHTAHVNGVPISYLAGGPSDKPVLLLVHGYTADASTWAAFARHLTRDFRVIVPDLPAHGRTPFTSGAGYGAPAQAERVARLVTGLGISRVHVIGNSMGGFIAAHLALAHPDLVASLCLCDAAGVVSTPSDAEAALQREGANPFLPTDTAGYLRFYALVMSRPPFAPRPIVAAMGADHIARRESYAEVFEDFYQRDYLTERLAEITTPTLVMWGAEDRIVHPDTAVAWAAIADAESIVYDGIGHLPYVEIPARSARDWRAFVQRHLD